MHKLDPIVSGPNTGYLSQLYYYSHNYSTTSSYHINFCFSKILGYDKYTFCIFFIECLHIGHFLSTFCIRIFAQSLQIHAWPHGWIITSTFSIKQTLQQPLPSESLFLWALCLRLSSALKCSFSSLVSLAFWNMKRAAAVAKSSHRSSKTLKSNMGLLNRLLEGEYSNLMSINNSF